MNEDDLLATVAAVWFVAGLLSMGAIMTFSMTLTPIGSWLLWFILIMTLLALVIGFMRVTRQ